MALIIAVPVTVFAELTSSIHQPPFPDDSTVSEFESQFTAQAIIQQLTTAGAAGTVAGVAASPGAGVAAAWPSFSSGFLLDVYVINMIADYLYGGTSAWADAAPPSPLTEPPTGWEYWSSLFTLATESVVFITACPFWAQSPPNSWAWTAWGVSVLAPACDIAWFSATEKITQLNQDIGVTLSFGVGRINLGIGIIAAPQQQYPALMLPSAILSAMPGMFRLLRLMAIENLVILGVPVKPWNRFSLAGVDLLAQVVSGTLAFYASYRALAPFDQAAPA
jgi:hypothetical protein